MEHFYQDIDGWFSYEYIYKQAVEGAGDNALFVEIGSFKGKSTAFMCVEIINSGKKISFDCIDPQKLLGHYADSATEKPEVFEGYNTSAFHERLAPVRGYYNLIEKTSDDAVNYYPDGSIDFIMIDGDHSYEGVKKDVLNYIPKMKPGGIMVGDDAFAEDVRRAAFEAAEEKGLRMEMLGGIHFLIRIPR